MNIINYFSPYDGEFFKNCRLDNWVVDVSLHVALVDSHPHADVSTVSPSASPGVLHDPVLLAAASRHVISKQVKIWKKWRKKRKKNEANDLPDSQDGVVDGGLAARGIVVDTAAVAPGKQMLN